MVHECFHEWFGLDRYMYKFCWRLRLWKLENLKVYQIWDFRPFVMYYILYVNVQAIPSYRVYRFYDTTYVQWCLSDVCIHLLASMELADWSECKFFDIYMQSMDTWRTGLHENCKYIHVARGRQQGWADGFVSGWATNSGVAERLERASGPLNCTAAQPSWRHRFAILI